MKAAAEESYQQAYQIAKQYADSYGLVTACAALALHHDGQGDSTAAKEYARQGLAALSHVEMSSRDAKLLRQTLERISGKRRVFWRW